MPVTLPGCVMRFLATLSLFIWLNSAAAQSIRLLIQSSPLAGSQYYALATCWPQIRVGDELALIREAENRHDARAIRVLWQGQQLGYLPRAENQALAEAMDQGERLRGRVARLTEHPDPWRRVVVEVYLEL